MNQTENSIPTGTTTNENTSTQGEKPVVHSKALCATCGAMKMEHFNRDHEFKARPRGFAAISKERVQEIASKGGKAAHAAGTAHRFSHDEAVAAGKKGGKVRTEKHGPVGVRSSVEPK